MNNKFKFDVGDTVYSDINQFESRSFIVQVYFDWDKEITGFITTRSLWRDLQEEEVCTCKMLLIEKIEKFWK